jgi:uncharacterized protein YjbJ (UPF0337 family)
VLAIALAAVWKTVVGAEAKMTLLSFDKERAFVSAVGLKVNIPPEATMSSGTTDKIKGATNEAVGKAKRALGKATGSTKLKREGDIQEAKGDAQTAIGKAKTALKR